MILQVENNRVVKVIGDKEHPANFGRLCTKGFTCARAADCARPAGLRFCARTRKFRGANADGRRARANRRAAAKNHRPSTGRTRWRFTCPASCPWKRNISRANWPRDFCARTTLIPIRASACRARRAATSCRSARTARPVRIRTLTGWIARWSSARTWPTVIRFCFCACWTVGSKAPKSSSSIRAAQRRRTRRICFCKSNRAPIWRC